jgi:hypothetical protein
MAYKGAGKVARSLIAGSLTRLFVVIGPRAAVTMTTAGAGVGYQSQFIDLSEPAIEVPMSEVTLDVLDEVEMADLSSELPQKGAYPTRDVSTITTRYWHHTASGDDATWQAIASGHIKRGWAGIGYHIGIDKNGRIAILNPLHRRTNHTAGRNSKGVGVVLLGNYDTHYLTGEMEAAIERTRDYLDERGITQEQFHRDVKATACPGRYAVQVLTRGRL